MSSAILISNLRKSLYTRLYYSLVDSDYLIKAISDKEIQTMLDTVKNDVRMIRDVETSFSKEFPLENETVPSPYTKIWENMIKNIEIKYPYSPSDFTTEGVAKRKSMKEKQKKSRAAQFRHIKRRIIEDYPDRDEGILETELLLDYIKRVHGGNTEDIKSDIKAYKQGQDASQKKNQKKWDGQRKEKEESHSLINQKVQEKLADWKKQLASKKEEDYKNQPESAKLVEDWAQQIDIRGIGSYKTFLSLISLVGTLSSTDEKSILRLKKFLTENKDSISQEDSVSLSNILTELEKEYKEFTKIRSRKTEVSKNAIAAKSHGLDIGKNSKFNKGKTAKKTSLSLTYADNQKLLLRGIKMGLFDNFEVFDMRNNRWMNNPDLREITSYWVETAGYHKGLQAWENEENDIQTRYIKRVEGILPDYPAINTDKMKAALISVYNNIWIAEYEDDEISSAEDFSYFLRGIQSGLSGNVDNTTEDFNKLKNFKDGILPNLIRAVKKGILVTSKDDGTREYDIRIGPVFSKVMRKLGNSKERREVVNDFIAIISNKSLSNKYAGRDAAELRAIEQGIIDLVSPKLYDKTIASYIISTFMDIYGTSILKDIFKDKDTAVEVEYLKTQYNPEAKKPTKRRNYTDSIDEKKIPKPKPKPKSTPKVAPKQDLSDLDEAGPANVFSESLKETKKSLDNLLIVMREKDNIILKEDTGIILESLNKKQRKKVKAILNIADPTEYFGHDFLKLEDLIKVLKSLGVVKGDKKLNKKILKLEDENLKVVKLATRLRKDYEILYRNLREMVYPKSGE